MAPATVLVIDDDPAMRMLMTLSLQRSGYIPVVADTGEAGVVLARTHSDIRVIICDVIMPGLSGIELAARLKEVLPGAAMLFCSGHPASALTGYGVAADSANFLQKPCGAADLERKIEELVART